MTASTDTPARIRALTELDSNLLVEAAAGTGKTALMAGRVTMLLASNVDPANIAAITFTELAANELSARVHRYVDDLLADNIPEPLVPALPRDLTLAQRDAIARAVDKLDELTATTIHGFCQAVISAYAVEADIDPGARVLDDDEAKAAFGRVFEQWVSRRLSGAAHPDDPIVALSRENPRQVVAMLGKLAAFQRDHRTANAPSADYSGRPDIDFVEAVNEFRRWFASTAGEKQTAELIGQLDQLAAFYTDSFVAVASFPRLWQLAHPPSLPCMRKDCSELRRPLFKTAWIKVAGADDGARLWEEAERLFERADNCYRTLLGRIARNLVAILSRELDEVLDAYQAFKRSAAVLDFDDLLYRAHALVRSNEAVRSKLGARYRHILIDEFQDTDPMQAEILFLISAEQRADLWADSPLRPGALFMVGDPKQAIYRFRGADVVSYRQARAAIAARFPQNVIQITANFRARAGILDYINHSFEAPLSRDGQPGYVPLTATIPDDPDGLPCIAKLRVQLPPNPRAIEIREAEASAVAELCARLIGRLRILNENGKTEPLAPSGIALLTPSWTELWRYERALERADLPVASQAGKGLHRRQEFQDLLALTRALGDPADTLAFGAFMRGPFVGLSEEDLLDITASLPLNPERPDLLPRFSLRSDPAQVKHPIASETLFILRDLQRRARRTTPFLLLSEAAERLLFRPILAVRPGEDHARALANLDAFLERARPYAVKGLRRFARDLGRAWASGDACAEGQIDLNDSAIQLVTMHSAKGLEWPVVIPINMGTAPRPPEPFVHRPSDDTLYWLIGEVVPPQLREAMIADSESLAREHERLLYVACTRARDLLVVPELSGVASASWARKVNLANVALPEFDVSKLPPARRWQPPAEVTNPQTAEVFEDEAESIRRRSTRLEWLRPSEQDADRMLIAETATTETVDAPDLELPVGAGRIRGLVLHKLLEEILTGEIDESEAVLAARAATLMRELLAESARTAVLPDKDEIAATARRALRLPEIAAMRPTLVPELTIFALSGDQVEQIALSGRADAIAFDNGHPSIVLDWKSDAAPGAGDIGQHAAQLQHYMAATGAKRGVLVYLTPGTLRWVDPLTTASVPPLGRTPASLGGVSGGATSLV
jgi:CRISPR-associated exonuclease Cas4